MNRRLVEHEGDLHLVSFPDEASLRPAARRRPMVQARLIDEITGRPPLGRVRIETDRTDLTGQAARSGSVGLVGVPERVLPPEPLAMPAPFRITIEADGFLRVEREANVGPLPNFPNEFTPADLGEIDLHRLPIRIAGRVTQWVAGAHQAVGGATVSIEEVWPQLPAPTAPPGGDPAHLIWVGRPVHRVWDVGPSRVRAVTMAPAGVTHDLREPVSAGARRMRLSDRVGLVPGSVLELDWNDADRREYAVVEDFEGPVSPDEPTFVNLNAPLGYTHRLNAEARAVMPGALGPDNGITRATETGDACIFMAAMAGMVGADAVALDAGGPLVDYHVSRRYVTSTDPEGYYRLPPISRLAKLRLHADAGAGLIADREHSPDYTTFENTVDLVVS